MLHNKQPQIVSGEYQYFFVGVWFFRVEKCPNHPKSTAMSSNLVLFGWFGHFSTLKNLLSPPPPPHNPQCVPVLGILQPIIRRAELSPSGLHVVKALTLAWMWLLEPLLYPHGPSSVRLFLPFGAIISPIFKSPNSLLEKITFYQKTKVQLTQTPNNTWNHVSV